MNAPWDFPPSLPGSRWPHGWPPPNLNLPSPLKVSANHRHLEDSTGKPFLLVGDTAWSLIAQLKREEVNACLDDRRRGGFSAIIVSLIEHEFADKAPAMMDGTQPFLAPADFARPNPAYFDRAFDTEPGFTVELVAAEPLTIDPVALAFDERGRLFVAENRDYPTGSPDGGSLGVIARRLVPARVPCRRSGRRALHRGHALRRDRASRISSG